MKELKHRETIAAKTATGLEAYLGASIGTVDLEVYNIEFKGIVAQNPGEENVYLVEAGAKVRIEPRGRLYCRWHTGPLDRRDNVLERRYCSLTSDTKSGYCLKHSRTYRALYDRCVGTSGEYALEACRKVEERIKVPMGTYILDRGLDKYKAGVSRSWRLEDRIAEQPHVVASIVARGLGLVESRELELKLSQHHHIQQLTKRTDPRSVLTHNPEKRLPLLYNVVRSLGLTVKPEFLTVRPRDEGLWINASLIKEAEGIYTLADYWGGYLLLEHNNGSYGIISFKSIQHSDTLTQIS
jgi:hypothetical protein